jgi:hypothetical protein
MEVVGESGQTEAGVDVLPQNQADEDIGVSISFL